MTGPCLFCDKPSPLRVKANTVENNRDLHVCDMHWKILQNPHTALPFLRGVSMMQLQRDEIKYDGTVKKLVEGYFDSIAKWKKQNPKN
jgi:hypothetical protein